jgi:hypothetical protein
VELQTLVRMYRGRMFPDHHIPVVPGMVWMLKYLRRHALLAGVPVLKTVRVQSPCGFDSYCLRHGLVA